jgi:hypothetical protein
MTEPKKGTVGLSETAKSHIEECVLAEIYGFRDFQGNKFTQKGIECEDDAIRFLGAMNALGLTKHEGRKSNEWITGECDILTDTMIRDIKCPWSIGTFPFFDGAAEAAVKKSGYDWQMRGYMWLYDRPSASIDYVLLPTPRDLVKWGDDPTMLIDAVENVPLHHRVKSVEILRDLEIEKLMITKLTMAQAYAKTLIEQLKAQ